MPYARLGYTQSGYSAEQAAGIGIDLEARPSLDEVMEVRSDRLAAVRRIMDGLTEAELERQCTRSPAPGYPEEPHTVRQCLGVVTGEEIEHYRYATRDLAVLEARDSR
jgi:hypothetical protein